MARKRIARIRLAAGEVGFYDQYTNIHLTMSDPEAIIYSGMNLYNIKTSLKSGRLRLVEGSLVEEVEQKHMDGKANTVKVSAPKKPVIKVEVEERPAEIVSETPEPVKTEEKTEMEPVEAEPVTVNTEEPMEVPAETEQPKPRRNRRKKKAAEEPAETPVEEEAEPENV